MVTIDKFLLVISLVLGVMVYVVCKSAYRTMVLKDTIYYEEIVKVEVVDKTIEDQTNVYNTHIFYIVSFVDPERDVVVKQTVSKAAYDALEIGALYEVNRVHSISNDHENYEYESIIHKRRR